MSKTREELRKLVIDIISSGGGDALTKNIDKQTDALMQLPALRLAEKAEDMNRDDKGPRCAVFPALLNVHESGGRRYVVALIDTCESVVTRAWSSDRNPDRLETYRVIEVATSATGAGQ